MRKALAGTERLAEDKEYCLLQEFCSDMASDVEITDPEEVRLTAPVKGTNTGWLWLLDVLSNLTRKEPIICTGWGERRSGAGIYTIGKNRASQKWRH